MSNGFGIPVMLLILCNARLLCAGLLEDRFESFDSSRWSIEGRGASGVCEGALRLTGCEAAAGDGGWTDYELSFRARAPREAEQAQLWASVRRTARDSRYVVGVRGGNMNVLYIARYAPNGRQLFLGTRPLERPPKPGEWLAVRIAVTGRTIRVFLGDGEEPAMEVSDGRDGWLERGGISLGGGFLATEYDDVAVRAVEPENRFGEKAIKLNFQPESMEQTPGWTKVDGAVFAESRAFGWKSPLTAGERRRNKTSDPVRDSVISLSGKLEANEFQYRLPDGDYLVTLMAGDPGYPIAGRAIVQGDEARGEVFALPAQQSVDIVRAAEVRDGMLRVKLERTGKSGLSVQGLVIERRAELVPGRWEKVQRERQNRDGQALKVQEKLRQAEVKRQQQRAEFRPVAVELPAACRAEVSLDGKWLFLPDYEFKQGVDYAEPGLDDRAWHVMDVPAFWTTADNWLYDERQGGSDRWNQLERARLGKYTFDWQKTQAAWYRQVVELKAVPAGRRFELSFDAIAKVAEIYVNGHRVAENVGMFRPAQVDVTGQMRQGRNVIAVRVVAVDKTRTASDKVETVAVTVAVTEKMLKTLPHAIYCGEPGGIWQPVKLVVHRDVQVKEFFFQPRLDGAKVELTLENKSAGACSVVPELDFTSRLSGAVLKPQAAFEAVPVAAGGVVTVTVDTGVLAPELWTPAKPNLYTMRVALKSAGVVVDEQRVEVGFRTFEARGDRLYLNGKPYWLRGGSHTPMPTCPNDAALAEKFTRLMHDGNVRVTRSVCAPWNELWLSCADRNGVGVSQEGPWPWLMINGQVPEQRLLNYWRDEHLALIRKYRNHPSILFWTFNNESYYVRLPERKVLEPAVTILSDTIKAMRKLDPTRPICPDSGGVYSMFPAYYEALAKEKGFDYGDIDDKHDYTSWYARSFFQNYPGEGFFDGHTGTILKEQLHKWKTPGRPLISQEMSTGYPNADDGHAVRKYIFDHMVPQAWVGGYAYEHHDPRYILESVAFNTKEHAETLRCYYRETMAGVVHFALNCWFQNLFEADRIRPYPPAIGLAAGLEPVLVSARLFGRHFYAGARPEICVFVVNDDEDGRDLQPTRLAWAVECQGRILAKGEQQLPAVPYYSNHQARLTVSMPDRLPQPRVEARLVLELFEGDRRVTQSCYELTLAERGWVAASAADGVQVLDAGRVSGSLWKAVGVTPRWLDHVPAAGGAKALVAGGYEWVDDAAQREQFLKWVEDGGTALLLNPGDKARVLFPGQVIRHRVAAKGEIAMMRVPESPVFDGIEVMDMRWFNLGDRVIPAAVRGDFKLAELPGVEILATYTRQHGYLTKPEQKADSEGAVVFSLRHGRGQVLVSELVNEAAVNDPIAARLVRNLLP